MNHYETLGVEPNATAAQIKEAFRRKISQWHPDHNPGDLAATRATQALNEAYGVLRDPLKRKQYDSLLELNGHATPTPAESEAGRACVERDGRFVIADEVYFACWSWDIERMEAAVDLKTTRTDRHFLLLQLCSAMYSQRFDAAMRAKFLRYAAFHRAELPHLLPAVIRDLRMDDPPHVPTLQNLATVLTEDGSYDEAIRVCEEAQALGLHDWTKSGFQGRINRIRRTQARTLQEARPNQ